MQWDDYKFILALSRANTLRGAAQMLGINHATMSRRLARIHADQDLALFERQGGTYQPTPYGIALIEIAERMEKETFRAERLRRAKGQAMAGPIRLSLAGEIAEHLLMDDILAFRHAHPDIDLTLALNYQYVDLDKSEADIVVRAAARPPDHLIGRRLFPYYLTYYAAPDYLAKTAAADRQWMIYTGAGHDPDWVARSPFPDSPIGLRATSVNYLLSLAEQGYGMIRGACFMADHNPNLVRITEDPPYPVVDLWVLTHPDLRHTPRIKALSSYLYNAIDAKRDRITGAAVPKIVP